MARHLVNSPKDSDIEERQRMQRKVHQAQEIQLEMSQLDRQNEELEANSREVEEALRASEGSKWAVQRGGGGACVWKGRGLCFWKGRGLCL